MAVIIIFMIKVIMDANHDDDDTQMKLFVGNTKLAKSPGSAP